MALEMTKEQAETIRSLKAEINETIQFLEGCNMVMGKCWLCGKKRGLTQHHITPQKKGGTGKGKIPVCENCHIIIEQFKQIIELMKKEKGISITRFKKALNTIGKDGT